MNMGKQNRSQYFPEEIITNITSRLPATSIGRYRCVSKLWRTLLSQPDFIKRHIDHIRNYRNLIQKQSFLFTIPKSGSFGYSSYPFLNVHPFDITNTELPPTKGKYAFTRILGSCDGLVVLEAVEGHMFVVNPITMEKKHVPPLMLLSAPVRYGLGYDSVHDDYKFVLLCYEDSSIDMAYAHVYSVKNNTWKKCESSPYNHNARYVYSARAVFVDGCIHLVASDKYNNSPSFMISAFDLSQEFFYEVAPPSSICNYFWDCYFLEELQGHLCLIQDNYLNKQTYVYVWIMKEYGNKESWTKLKIVVLEGLCTSPICTFGKEQALILLMIKDGRPCEASLVAYNSENESPGDIKVLVKSYFMNTRLYFSRVTFTESFVWPHY